MTSARGVLAVLAAAAMCTLTACGSDTPAPGARAGGGAKLTVATVQSWNGFNPYVPDQGNTIGLGLAHAIYPSAFDAQPDQTAALNTDLLESATVTSEKPQTVTYKISQKAAWSDGTPITADDFVFLWKHLNGSDPGLLVSSAIGYKQISSVAADGDPKTVKVVFDSPFADWQSLFSMLLPAHHMASLGDDTKAWNTGLASAPPPSGGPYRIAENRPDEYLRLTANPAWYGAKPKVEEMTVRFFGDDQAVVQALASGEAGYAFNLAASRALIDQIRALPNVTTDIVPTTNQQYINTQFSRPGADDLAVRQAIATVVDPGKVASTVFGGDVTKLLTTHHVYAPSSPYYVDNRPAGFGSGDAAAATSILEKAGYAKGSDGVYARDGRKLELTYIARAEDQLAKQVGVILQDELKKIGIAIKIKTPASADWFKVLGSGDYDLGLGNYPAHPFPVSWYSALYTCKGGYNFVKYCDEEVDRDYNAAYAELDPKARAELMNTIEKRLWADVANIPMWEAPQVVTRSSGITGVRAQLPREYQLLDAAQWNVAG
ncbi:ABC transporter family substrate-binding protein [Streptosporangium sp. NPDC051022]|uniref:ABC transporter family substrate-binding protein n=1 Tax=Streptosporangium sp. NPDC051022 TaxID=3155752 RepID=UPI00341D837F